MSIQKGRKAIEKDQAVINQGDPATNELFYMTKGTAIAEVDGQPVGTIQAGEWFGEMAALLGAKRTATVRAVTPCEVVVFRGLHDKALLDTMQKDPKLVQKLIETLAMRLVEASRRTVDTTVKSSGTLERYRKAISGTMAALDKVCEKYKTVRVMQEVKEHLAGVSGVSEADPKDMNIDFFRHSKAIIQG